MINVSNKSAVNPVNFQGIDCLGVVLAGGLSSRMGQDKTQLTRAKNIASTDIDPKAKSFQHSTWSANSAQTMLDFSQQILKDAGINDIVISGDNHQIPDRIAHAGPVGGIYSTLAHCLEHYSICTQPKAFLILPVDLPLMSASVLSELRLKGELSQKATFFSDSQQQAHHIPLYLPNNAFLQAFMAQAFQEQNSQINNSLKNNSGKKQKNGPSVKAMLEHIPHQCIISKSSRALFNTNTPAQWQQAQQYFK